MFQPPAGCTVQAPARFQGVARPKGPLNAAGCMVPERNVTKMGRNVGRNVTKGQGWGCWSINGLGKMVLRREASWNNDGIPSGSNVYSLRTWKWPSRQFVSFPINSMVDLSSSLCKRLPGRVNHGTISRIKHGDEEWWWDDGMDIPWWIM